MLVDWYLNICLSQIYCFLLVFIAFTYWFSLRFLSDSRVVVGELSLVIVVASISSSVRGTHPRIGGGRGRGRQCRQPLLVPSETDCIPAEGIDRRRSERICPPPTKADDMVRYGASQTALFWATLVLIVTSLLPSGSAYFIPDSRVSYEGLPVWLAVKVFGVKGPQLKNRRQT